VVGHEQPEQPARFGADALAASSPSIERQLRDDFVEIAELVGQAQLARAIVAVRDLEPHHTRFRLRSGNGSAAPTDRAEEPAP